MKKVTVIEAESMLHDDPEKMLKEYENMLSEAERRQERLRQSEFSWTKTANKQLPPSAHDMDIRDLPKAFSEVSKFLASKSSTVSGQRDTQRKTIHTLNKAIGAGDDDDEEESGSRRRRGKVNKGNFARVIKLLERAREMKITYDSEKLVELADLTIGMDDSTFESMLDDLDWAVRNREQLGDLDYDDMDAETFEDFRNQMKRDGVV